jgi:hypothetical protein
LTEVGSIVRSPRLAVHGAVHSLGLVVLGENIDVNLVADGWLSSGRWVTAIVSGLGLAGSGAGENTLGESWIFGEGEELVAHVGVGLGLWVKGCVEGTTKNRWAVEAVLWSWWSNLVITI